MRTTININDSLLQSVKRRAAENHSTLTAVIEDALRLSLSMKAKMPRTNELKIPTSGKGGLQPGVDLDDTATLTDRMENSD